MKLFPSPKEKTSIREGKIDGYLMHPNHSRHDDGGNPKAAVFKLEMPNPTDCV